MKVVSPIGINLICDALTHIYWKKEPQKKFIKNLLIQHHIEMMMDWSLTKRQISDEVINRLAKDQDKYFKVLTHFIEELCKFDDFSHLKREEDSAIKIRDAENAVNALKKFAETHLKTKQEKYEALERAKVAQKKQKEVSSFNEKLDLLKADFLAMYSLQPQARGYKLENFMRELLSLFDLEPKKSYKLEGEQIDGHFSCDGSDYLLETKWEEKPLAASDVYSFTGKIAGKLDNTLGFFVSINGFSEEALIALEKTSKKVCILCDGQDLIMVLEARIRLDDLIIRKKRHAIQTGQLYISVKEIL
jgi:hypothetical protein